MCGIVIFMLWCARPLSTDDAWTIDEGTFEIEVGYDFEQGKNNERSGECGVSIKHGFTNKLDFYVAIPYQIEPAAKGLGGAECGTKFLFVSEKEAIPDASLTFTYGLGSSEYSLNGIISKETKLIAGHLNLGYTSSGVESEKGIVSYSVAVEFPIGEKPTLVGEFISETGGYREGLIGGNFQIIEPLALDFGVGITNNENKWRTTLGLTYGF